jgi:hypothetical protein
MYCTLLIVGVDWRNAEELAFSEPESGRLDGDVNKVIVATSD